MRGITFCSSCISDKACGTDLCTCTCSQGLALAQKDSDNRELCAKLHQTELNNTLQQDLLRHMMADQVDIEVDNLLTNNDGK